MSRLRKGSLFLIVFLAGFMEAAGIKTHAYILNGFGLAIFLIMLREAIRNETGGNGLSDFQPRQGSPHRVRHGRVHEGCFLRYSTLRRWGLVTGFAYRGKAREWRSKLGRLVSGTEGRTAHQPGQTAHGRDGEV